VTETADATAIHAAVVNVLTPQITIQSTAQQIVVQFLALRKTFTSTTRGAVLAAPPFWMRVAWPAVG